MVCCAKLIKGDAGTFTLVFAKSNKMLNKHTVDGKFPLTMMAPNFNVQQRSVVALLCR